MTRPASFPCPTPNTRRHGYIDPYMHSGTPTRFGIGLREHLRALRAGELREQR